jgi:hypothetical protein
MVVSFKCDPVCCHSWDSQCGWSIGLNMSLFTVQSVTVPGARRNWLLAYICKIELCDIVFYMKVFICDYFFQNCMIEYKHRTKQNEIVRLSLIT